jgi:hypothetical protein
LAGKAESGTVPDPCLGPACRPRAGIVGLGHGDLATGGGIRLWREKRRAVRCQTPVGDQLADRGLGLQDLVTGIWSQRAAYGPWQEKRRAVRCQTPTGGQLADRGFGLQDWVTGIWSQRAAYGLGGKSGERYGARPLSGTSLPNAGWDCRTWSRGFGRSGRPTALAGKAESGAVPDPCRGPACRELGLQDWTTGI